MQPVEDYDIGLVEEEYEIEEDGIDWLAIANDAFATSDTFYGSSIGKQIEKNISLFNSKHVSGSKYNSDSYKYRSKIFRPKVRSSIRRHEAAAATAYFATDDIALCEPENGDDQEAIAGATIGERLINFRLKQPEMKWFQTCMGAYQDSMVQGCVISRQEWIYREKTSSEGLIDQNQSVTTVLEDRPACDLVPVENFRFDPNSDWRNPVEDSPYLIEEIPLFRYYVKERMDAESKDPSHNWFEIEDSELSSDKDSSTTSSTRRKRNEDRTDSTDQTHTNSDYDIIWVHRNIVRVDGDDYLFYTLGKKALLSEPVLMKDVYPHGRPYTMGFCNLEAHKVIPAAFVEMVAGIQQEINDIANQRLDNVKLVVNRRSFVRRNAKVDIRGLTHSVPGGVTLVDDINQDVRYDAPPDVTSSSYAEQDRLNNDFDELSGSFSGSSVASNKNMNETVGGMEIMTSDANSVTEYQLRIFTETWLKPTLKQILLLEKRYETDENILRMVSGGMPSEQVIQLLQKDIHVKISVGFGATSPQRRIEKLSFGLSTLANFMPQKLQKLNEEEITKEIFGALGYQDGKRFFKQDEQEDPRVQQLTQQVQEMQQMLQSRQMEIEGKIQVEQLKSQNKIQVEQIRSQALTEIARLEQQIDYIDAQIDAEKNDIKRGELIIQREAFDESKKNKELEYAIQERDRMSDVLMNNDYGMAPNIEEKPGRG